MSLDDVKAIFIVVGVVSLLLFGMYAETMMYHECREMGFSRMYCLSRR